MQVAEDEPVPCLGDVRDPAHHPLAAGQQDGHTHSQEGHRQQELVRGRPPEVSSGHLIGRVSKPEYFTLARAPALASIAA